MLFFLLRLACPGDGFSFAGEREEGREEGMTAGPPFLQSFCCTTLAFIDSWGAFILSFILLTLKGQNSERFYCLLSSTLALYLLHKIQPPNAQN
jgi:hypothetical protein